MRLFLRSSSVALRCSDEYWFGTARSWVVTRAGRLASSESRCVFLA